MSDNTECPECEESLERASDGILCTLCKLSYHTGQFAGVSDVTLKSKEDAYRKSWKSTKCRALKTCGEPEKNDQEPSLWDVFLRLETANQKLEVLMPLTETVDKIEESVQYMYD